LELALRSKFIDGEKMSTNIEGKLWLSPVQAAALVQMLRSILPDEERPSS
jgi:hypothetical protein